MKVVLAEKPSVARDLAAVLGARSRRDGYLEGNGYQITWAFGHLVSLKEPDDYDPSFKRWSLDTLPIIPETFQLKLTGDEGAQKQFRIIAKLFAAADQIVCATDAGREGELIFRYILELSGCRDKAFQRLWLSSLTEEAIRTAMGKLAEGHAYDKLYAAARCRSEADWIIGMNATRNFTVRFGQNGVLWSVGRVQTPVLALIARRDDEIRHFVPEPWFELRTRYRQVWFKYLGDRFTQKPAAEALAARIADAPLTITAVKQKQEQERPPQLYDLTALQRDMNVRYGQSAANVLKDTQTLYENKLVTYPRTDSRYLTSDMQGEVVKVLRKLGETHPGVAKLELDKLPKDKRIFDDKKVQDHHAIIPTGRKPGRLSPAAEKIYDAIVTRMIAAFYPPCQKEVTTVDAVIQASAVTANTDQAEPAEAQPATPCRFRARGVRITAPGWTALYPKKKPARSDGDDDRQDLPEFVVDESGPHAAEVKEGETRPPRHYNENSLLAAMETAGRLVEDEELKEALKARGLGTPATRAAIIETLLRRRYIRRDKKALLATDLGRYLIALIQNPILKSAEMTGEWEARLHEIETGKLGATAFMDEIVSFTRDVITSSEIQRGDPEQIGACPRCGSNIVEGKRGYGCSAWRDGCDYVLWKDYLGHTVSERQARDLLQRRLSLRPLRIEATPVVLAMTDQHLLTHIAVPMREHQRGSVATKPKVQPKPATPRKPRSSTSETAKSKAKPAPSLCPLCQHPMVERDTAYCCSAWRAGCRFAIHKTIAGKKISKAMVRKLLTKGTTQVLKGFQSKSNKPFDARLKLDQGRVRFEFE